MNNQNESYLLELIHKKIFGDQGRKFGTSKMPYQGVSNARDGVQWHFVIDRKRGFTRMGINLEGLKYDGWPIARLISRELENPKLLEFKGSLSHPKDIYVYMRRDAWQVTARPAIEEQIIGDIPISDLTPAQWEFMLCEADGCLDKTSGSISRAIQKVTLKKKKERRTMQVSPHLMLYCLLWYTAPNDLEEGLALVIKKMNNLQPLFGFVESRSSS